MTTPTTTTTPSRIRKLIAATTAALVLSSSSLALAATITGTNGNDTRYGTAKDDVMKLLDGKDGAYGRSGDDRILGGDDNDVLVGDGYSANGQPPAQPGDDIVNGQRGRDLLFGEEGDDTLRGGLGADVIYGGDDDDEVRGGPGSDYLFPDDGNDHVRAGGDGDAVDFINCGPGTDSAYADVNDVFQDFTQQQTTPQGAGCENVTYAP